MLLNKISSLEARVNANRLEFREMVSGVTRSLFSKRIADVEAPSKYTTLKVKKNNGDLDPYEYVCHFEQKMQTISILTTKLEAMKCKAFTQGLPGPVLLWFHQLPTRSVDGYDELIGKFISNFSINIKVLKTPDDLFSIK